MIKQKKRIEKVSLNLILLICIWSFTNIGCGLTDTGSSNIQRINASEVVFTLEDLIAGGFKKVKTYKVKDLPGATGAYYGFYDKTDYEIRFYQTHGDALELGLEIAEERVGPTPEDVKIRKDDATWKEGLKEARLCTGPTTGSTSGGGTVIGAGGMGGFCVFPKYKDLIVYGNFILLCQGNDESESKKNCIKLVKNLEGK